MDSQRAGQDIDGFYRERGYAMTRVTSGNVYVKEDEALFVRIPSFDEQRPPYLFTVVDITRILADL